MYSDNQGDDCLKNFPIEKSLFDANETPYIASLPELLRTFRNAVGYELKFERASKNAKVELCLSPASDLPFDVIVETQDRAIFPIGDPSVKIYGNLIIERNPSLTPRLDWTNSVKMVSALAGVLTDNYRWRVRLEECEGELATTIPLDNSPRKTAVALREILRIGAAALGGFDAAALYLLDPTTTYLFPRALWGLPKERFLDEPRELRSARAEVEALLGSAVVVNDDYLAEEWNVPEDFASSVCVPVLTDATVLGVVWFYANKKRGVTDRELETLNLIVGRIVDELEKTTAIRQAAV